MDISFDGILKKEGISYRNNEKYNQAKELFSTFLGYIKAHDFDDELIKKVCCQIVHDSFHDVLATGYTWRDYDYDKHYMINLRWIYYLITVHKRYPLLYDINIAKRQFFNCYEYCGQSHTEGITDHEYRIKKRWLWNRVNDFLEKTR